LALTLGITLALTTRSAVAGVSAMPIASIVSFLYARAQVQSLLGPIAWKWDPKGAWDVAVRAFPFLVIVALGTINERLGVLMLYSIQGSDAVATFASGERIITAAAITYTMLSAAALPTAARFATIDRKQHHTLVNQVARMVNLAAIPTATILFLFSDDVIAILFGNEFASSAAILKTVAWVFAIRAVSTIQQMGAISTGRQRDVVTSRVFGLVFLFVLGVPLAWVAGPLGMAYAMLGAEIGYAAVLHVLLRRAAVTISPLNASLPTIAACGISIVVAMLMSDAVLPARAALVAGCLVVGLWGLGAVNRYDIEYLWAVLRTKRSDL
jgi:O-antigen/teichoic acid export membrane protein